MNCPKTTQSIYYKAYKRHSISQVWEVILEVERVLWEVPNASKPQAVVPSLSSAY